MRELGISFLGLESSQKMSKLLIIGGTGFFGKSILDANKKNLFKNFGINEIIINSRDSSIFKKSYPELIKDNISFFDGDISNLKNLPNFDYVIHAATSSNKLDYTINEEHQLRNIKLGAKNFVDIIKKKPKNIKVLYCSSGAVYGQQPQNVSKLKESHPLISLESMTREKRVYALGKRYAEESINELSKFGYKCVIARCFAFYGKYLPKNQHFAYGNFVGLAEKGNDIIVKARNNVYRSYMSADNLSISLLSLLIFNCKNFEIYNVGSPNYILIHDLAHEISKKYKVKVISNKIDESLNHDRYVPDTQKLESFLIKNKIDIDINKYL